MSVSFFLVWLENCTHTRRPFFDETSLSLSTITPGVGWTFYYFSQQFFELRSEHIRNHCRTLCSVHLKFSIYFPFYNFGTPPQQRILDIASTGAMQPNVTSEYNLPELFSVFCFAGGTYLNRVYKKRSITSWLCYCINHTIYCNFVASVLN